MTDYFHGATFEENGRVRRSVYRGVGDLVKTNVTMKHRIPLSELIDYVQEHARDVPLSEIMLNWATVSWQDEATPEEIAVWQDKEKRKAEARERWERETLAKLTAKYGAVDRESDA
ncbi:hypothetical protein B0I12_002542 [Microbacterium hydrothermale]|uniref:hypothetical protein n=1 Tax=Microbacterium hydrothermale TaxID=857427 RepID=UPI002227F768|nr:hypothetical protein [Microbacterium hydrothermale]MCW2165387.1 hypothetical protein [Microbacterium hydrothermale]